MTTTHDEAAGLEAPWPPEWWERWADRRAAWAARHATLLRRLLVARLALLAVSLVWLVVASLLLVDVRQSMVAVYAGSAWVCVLWFLVLRSKTVTLAGMLKWFAAAVLWSWLAGLMLYALSRVGGEFPTFTGPTTMIASFGEESLKLLPLAVLALVAPGRVRRFSAADWMLLGIVSGAGFECAENVLARIAARDQWGDALFIVSNLTTYGPAGSTPAEHTFFFPGHHVTTGLVASAVGLAVALWRWSDGPDATRRVSGRVGAVAMVALTWWAAVSVHATVNLRGQDLDLLPWPIRWCFTVQDGWWGATPMLVVVVGAVLAVDGRRQRRNGGWILPLPLHRPLLRVDDALARVAAPSKTPAPLQHVIRGGVDVLRSWWFVLADTVRAVTTFVAAGARQPGERWWHAARLAQASVVLTRRSRELVLAETAPPASPTRARVAAVATVVALLAAAFPIGRAMAQRVETTRDRSLGITWWMAGLLDRFGDWWGDLSGWEKVLVVGAAFALTALAAVAFPTVTVGGALLWGVSGASAAYTVADNTDTLADVVRDPGTAAEKYWKDATPASVLLDAGTLALTFWAPAKLAPPLRATVADFARAPRAWVEAKMLELRHYPSMPKDLWDGIVWHRRVQNPLVRGETVPGFAPRAAWTKELYVQGPGTPKHYRLDLYGHPDDDVLGEIVSLKRTQYSDTPAGLARARADLDELVTKYHPETKISTVPSTPEPLLGQSLEGKMVLGVPKQKHGIPESILRLAHERRIEIREIDVKLPWNMRPGRATR